MLWQNIGPSNNDRPTNKQVDDDNNDVDSVIIISRYERLIFRSFYLKSWCEIMS